MNMSAEYKLSQIKDQYILSLSNCHEIRRGMLEDMRIGLETNGSNSSSKMLPSRVLHLPNGSEKGVYYAIDWGGSNVRFLRLSLRPNSKPLIDQIKHKIPQSLQTCDNVDDLFNFLALKFKDHMMKYNELNNNKIYSVGFTFSFPIKQPSLNKGILIEWTKGFNIPGVVGRDIVELMNLAFNRYSIPAKIDAICNDTVGTLISCSYDHKNTMIGIIIGTGTNACYVESSRDNEVINTEWGCFDKYLPRILSTDILMDSYAVNKGSYPSEKMLSGMYVAEICRIIMNQIFKDKIPKNNSILLDKFGEFSGLQITIILREYYKYNKYEGIRRILNILHSDKYNLKLFDEQDVNVMINIFKLILNRSADLTASLLLGVLEKCGFYKEIGINKFVLTDKYKHDYITVGIDGGVFLNMPQYPQRIRKTMVNMIGDKIVNRINIHHSEDGSGRGAALCVAAIHRYNNDKIKRKSKL